MWGPIEDVRPGASRAAPSLIQPPPEQPDLLTLIGKHRDQMPAFTVVPCWRAALAVSVCRLVYCPAPFYSASVARPVE